MSEPFTEIFRRQKARWKIIWWFSWVANFMLAGAIVKGTFDKGVSIDWLLVICGISFLVWLFFHIMNF